MNTIIIAAFPLCGKTWCHDYSCTLDRTSLDLDSEKYRWKTIYVNFTPPSKIEDPDFPENYIQKIKDNIGKYDYIFISTDEGVLEAMDKENMDYVLVYPERKLIEEWVGRCWIRKKKRGGLFETEELYTMWKAWIDCLEKRSKEHKTYRLKAGQHLANVIFKIEKDMEVKYELNSDK